MGLAIPGKSEVNQKPRSCKQHKKSRNGEALRWACWNIVEIGAKREANAIGSCTMNLDPNKCWNSSKESWKTTLLIAYQSLGVVYSDLSISPLYVFKSTLAEKHKSLQTALLILVLLGTCMVIGDGVLTPTISVFSAVSSLELFRVQGTSSV
ncbi:hypothetical protein IFM89_012014 [Coptis chinensis]|uniref:K+ potassium transporter integral membrane domain-containing protein n=1 Tax=Coptis chinensis TaxID=261450 RepID=A0A835MCH9_9MAGN|nr:hypothetical protein IFM89_012014 [Coptis chinensis]